MISRLFRRRSDESEVTVPAAPADASGKRQSGRVYTFWSPKGEGATTSALYFAREMAKKGTTLLIDLNLRNPDILDCLDRNITRTPGWDSLWPVMRAGTLTPEQLHGTVLRFKQKATPAILAGLQHPEYAGNFSDPATLQKLITVAQNAYEYVIIDVSAELDNAATEACLSYQQNTVTIVMRPVWLSMKKYRWASSILQGLGLSTSQHQILLTGRREKESYPSQKVAEFCGVPVIGTLPFLEHLDKAIGLGQYADELDKSRETTEYLKVIASLANTSNLNE